MKLKRVLGALGAIILCQMAGVIGSLFTYKNIATWYVNLNKPFFNPPNWVFGPVWITLYAMMGVAFYLVWEKRKKAKAAMRGVVFFLAQLALNALWSIMFFGMKSPLLGLVTIAPLWALILASTYYFYKVSKPAAYLMVPYILWTSFAMVLNFFIWMLN